MFSLRDFLYLDERTIKRYLSSIEEGLVKQVMQTDVTEKPNWNFDISLGELQKLLVASGIPVPNIGVQRNGKNENISVQITKEPTIDSQFDKLFKYLDPVTQYLEGFDSDIWNQLERGQFIYYTSQFRLPSGYENAKLLSRGAEFYEFARGFMGQDSEFEKLLDDSKDYREELASKTFTNLYSLPVGSPNIDRYFFVTKLIHNDLVDIDLEDLTFGESKVLARIEHILQGNEKYTVFDATLKGVDKLLNREQRRKQKKDLVEVVSKPVIIARPIAIFQE